MPGIFYPDGVQVSLHPDEAEIGKYYEWWMERASEDQQEVLREMRNASIFKLFKETCKPHNSEEAITMAIEWWNKFYPLEVKEFLYYTEMMRKNLYNVKGFSNDREKLHMWQGSIPSTVKTLLLKIDPDFFRTDSNGKIPGYTKFYQIFTKARIGGKN